MPEEMTDPEVLARLGRITLPKPDAGVFNAWAASKIGEAHAFSNTAPAVERAMLPVIERKRIERRERELAEEQARLDSEKRNWWDELRD